MRLFAFLTALAALFACASCAPSHPLTSEEFAGFCYQQSTGINICSNIALCNEYRSVLEMQQESRNACIAECRAVYENQMRNQDPLTRCWFVSSNGLDLCKRHCNQAYPAQ